MRYTIHNLLCAMVTLSLSACVALPIQPASSEVVTVTSGEFTCGGAVELATWTLWAQHGLPFLRQQLITNRLQAQGDTYALYGIQVYFHNLAALARRCKRPERMREMADALMPVFDMLEPVSGSHGERAWLCRGGPVCNSRNRLIDTEVALVSVQGLSLISDLAEMMVTSEDQNTRLHPFISVAAHISAEHLLRWGNAKARTEWLRLAKAQASDVQDGSSTLFFTDHSLWMIAVYANLAGIYARQPALGIALMPVQRDALGGAARDLLAFFRSRITFTPMTRIGGSLQFGAEIDRGFWRLHADSRYAGYEGATPPATCIKQADGSRKAHVQVEGSALPLFSGLGWDFSHARRLVHVLDTLERNREALQTIFRLQIRDLPDSSAPQAFAWQLISSVWNRDIKYPLFSNYWNGANGWYRVAYDNGTGDCRVGYPPFGLSDSFTTGGYGTWARYEPVIGELARTLYRLSQSSNDADKAFVRKYYEGLVVESTNNRMLTQLMFWPTLIQ